MNRKAEKMKSREEEFKEGTPKLFQLAVALWDALMAHSAMVCYFMMILNQLVSASILSLPYCFSVFLWAMLSVPRPTKTYWVTVITYTEVRGIPHVLNLTVVTISYCQCQSFMTHFQYPGNISSNSF